MFVVFCGAQVLGSSSRRRMSVVGTAGSDRATVISASPTNILIRPHTWGHSHSKNLGKHEPLKSLKLRKLAIERWNRDHKEGGITRRNCTAAPVRSTARVSGGGANGFAEPRSAPWRTSDRDGHVGARRMTRRLVGAHQVDWLPSFKYKRFQIAYAVENERRRNDEQSIAYEKRNILPNLFCFPICRFVGVFG